MTKRLEWDEYFIKIAWAASERATCPVRKVGAVLVDPITMSIKTTSYNGSPRGTGHCPDHESGAPECLAIHAETNLITNAALNGISAKGSWLYLTCTPCIKCAPLTLNAGITRVVCDEEYRKPDGVEYLRDHNIPVRIFAEEVRAIRIELYGDSKPTFISPRLDNWHFNSERQEWEKID